MRCTLVRALCQLPTRIGASRWAVALLAGAWLAIATAAPAHALAFTPHVDFPTGHHPHFVAAGDLNGDDKADLVNANIHAATLSVLLGDGAGGFGPKTDYGAGLDPGVVAIADLNGDLIPDLVSGNMADSTSSLKTVSALLGQGGGAFGAMTQVYTGLFNVQSLAVGDLNIDGRPDLAVVPPGGATGAVLLGDGAGGFGAPIPFFETGPSVFGVAIGDLNGDSNPDLIVTYTTPLDGVHYVAVLLGDGTGSYGAWTNFVTPPATAPAAIGDVNGDGRADVELSGNNSLIVLPGDGAGALGPAQTFAAHSSGTVPAAIGDLNGDGRLDFATADLASSRLSISWGDGAGNFVESQRPPTGTLPASVALADFDGDGKLDIATANETADTVSVVLQLPPDTDGDGCADSREVLLVPPTNPSDAWDFYSVPVPALFAAPNPSIVSADNVVGAGDGQAVFGYFKKGAKTGSLEYEQDLNGNGIKDGLEYDRSVIGPGTSGPPDGAVTATDAQLAFAQFKRGYKC